MVRPARFERATICLEGRCSIQLSYGRTLLISLGMADPTGWLRHVPSDGYYARIRRRGKPVIKSKTKPISAAKLRLPYSRHNGPAPCHSEGRNGTVRWARSCQFPQSALMMRNPVAQATGHRHHFRSIATKFMPDDFQCRQNATPIIRVSLYMQNDSCPNRLPPRGGRQPAAR